MAIQRAMPTRIKPSRRPDLSGRNAHAKASYCIVNTHSKVDEEAAGPYHDEWSEHPVDNNAEEDLVPDCLSLEDMVKSFVSDFAEDWIHHYEETDCYRQISHQS
jgi:hypothetical protein